MKALLTIAAVLFVPACTHAQTQAPASSPAEGPKACDELKSEIAAKLDAKGVKAYTLEIVAKDQEVTEGKVVGTCGGGTKKIIYQRATAPAEAPAKDEKKPGTEN